MAAEQSRSMDQLNDELDDIAGGAAGRDGADFASGVAVAAHRFHALDDDSAPPPALRARMWDDLMGRAGPARALANGVIPANTVNGLGAASGAPVDSRKSRRHRAWPVTDLAAVAVVLLTLASGLAAHRLAPDEPGGRAAIPPGAQGTIPNAADWPDPDECRVAPRPASGSLPLSGTPSAPGILEPLVVRLDIPGAAPSLPRENIPPGRPADEETVASIIAAVREWRACHNAGDLARVQALYTDDYYRRWAIESEAAPAAVDQGASPLPPVMLYRPGAMEFVADVRVFDAGRVGARVARNPGSTEIPATYVVFSKIGDRWLIDEAVPVGAVLAAAPPGTPRANEPDEPIALTGVTSTVRVDIDGVLAGEQEAIDRARTQLEGRFGSYRSDCQVGFAVVIGYGRNLGEALGLAETINHLLVTEFPDLFADAAIEPVGHVDPARGRVRSDVFLPADCVVETSVAATVEAFIPTHRSRDSAPVKLRAKPATDGAIDFVLPPGTSLQFLGDATVGRDFAQSGSYWLRIRARSGEEGWIRDLDLQPVGPYGDS